MTTGLLADDMAEFFDALTAYSGLVTIAHCGSTARSGGDNWSDVDLLALYVDKPPAPLIASSAPSSATRKRIASERGGEEVNQSFLMGDGSRFDVRHKSLTSWRSRLEKVHACVAADDIVLAEQKPFSDFEWSRPLHGDAALEGLKIEVCAYPESLRRAMFARHVTFEPLSMIKTAARRRDLAAWATAVIDSVYCVLGLLFALNGKYHSASLKHLSAVCDRFHTCPPLLAERTNRLFADDPLRATDELESLVRETLHLLEEKGHFEFALAGARYTWAT